MNYMESAAHAHPPSFSGLHRALLSKNCRAESLNTWNLVEMQEGRGFQKAAELHMQIYTRVQMIFTYRKCPTSHEI